MGIPSRRFFLACVSLVCLSLPACMQVPVCIPELSYINPVDLGPASAEVHAFRVDITEKTVVNIDQDFKAAGGGVDYYEFTPLQLSAARHNTFAVGRELCLRLALHWNLGPLADPDHTHGCSALVSPWF